MAAAPKRHKTQSVPYLVHFPDKTSDVHVIDGAQVVEEGAEILDGWLVDTTKIIDEVVAGDPVSYAVWVRPAPPALQDDGEHLIDATGDSRGNSPHEPGMPLPVTADTRQKIANLPERLSDEFADVAPSDVRDEVEEVTGALLNDAQFKDFVPLLAHRYTREHLIKDGHKPSRDEEQP